MQISTLTLLILHVNSLIDSGKYKDITISDVHKAIEGYGILHFLKEKTGNDIDLNIQVDSDTYRNFESYYNKKLYELYSGYAGIERRKWGIKNSGLCLILAWTIEIIQQGEGLHY